MRSVGGLFGKKPIPVAVLGGVPELAVAYLALQKSDFGPLEALLSHGDAEHRYYFAMTIANMLQRPQVETFAQRRPGACSLLLKCAHGLTWAWEARSNRVAEEVTAEQFRSFDDRLREVTRDLEEFAASRPDDPNPLALQLILAKGQEWSLRQKQALFERFRALGPTHYAGFRNYLDAVLQKWGGKHRDCSDFALDAMRSGPEGCELGALLHAAYTEEWLFLKAFDKNDQQAAALCGAPAVVEVTREAYARTFGSSRHRDWPGSVKARNESAFWFYLCGQKDLLRREIKAIGSRLNKSPWQYLGEPARVFTDARKYAGV